MMAQFSFTHIGVTIQNLLHQADFSFQAKDLLDIIVIAFLIYVFMLLMKRTHSFFIFFGALILGGIYAGAQLFDLYLTRLFFQAMFPFIIFILVVIFQRELRYFFEWLATWRSFSFLKAKGNIREPVLNDIMATVTKLRDAKTGALIVFSGRQSIDQFLSGGTFLFGRISMPLLLSIFDDSSPGHDGAVVIKDGRIEKFGARLPLSEKFKSEIMGTRHCAAMGLSERSDAFTIVVSEERGTISYTFRGTLTTVKEPIELKDALQKFLEDQIPDPSKKEKWHKAITQNAPIKVTSIVLSIGIWFVFSVFASSGTVNRQFSIPVEFKFVPEGYAVDQITPKMVSVTFAGTSADFKLVREENLKITVDVGDKKEGSARSAITEADIDSPSNLEIVSFSPHTIRYTVKKQ